MRRLSLIILLLPILVFAQSPHGKSFSIQCDLCHTSSDWSVNVDKIKFDHSKTEFELSGQHLSVSCKSCHTSLKFENTEKNCFSCHTDVHENTVGTQCEDCHNNNSWVVNNIKEIHELQRFPLLGMHLTATCDECHNSASQLNFIPLGVNCVDCHLKDYQSTTSPNHVAGGYSTECEECHSFIADSWASANITHTFFPLVDGHNIGDCFACHNQNSYAGLSQECFSCHESDYRNAQAVDHQTLGLPHDCESCHTLSPGWSPASFVLHDNYFALTGAHANIRNNCNECHSNGYSNTSSDCFSCHSEDFNSTQNPSHPSAGFSTDCTECHNTQAWVPSTFDHDAQYFPIYSGAHRGEWSSCSTCHTTPNNFSDFTCTNCHEHNQTEMDSEHRGVAGYSYNSISCFGCHPTGRGEGGFNHSQTQFPLMGVHAVTLCSDCHETSYSGTSMECFHCHEQDFAASLNPSHQALGLSTNCDECHSFNSNWQPALFPEHANYFELDGAHMSISNDCASCHQGNYTNTSSECFTCHATDYNSTTNPSHVSAGFTTECSVCHTTTSWIPADFDHDAQFFPIYSGAHNSAWDNCAQCHIQSNSYAVFSCITCHEHSKSETDPEHGGVPGYIYTETSCYDCHPTSNEQGFNHSITGFALTGTHTLTACEECHTAGYTNTSSECNSCHNEDYLAASNPNHRLLGIDTNCSVCHSTEQGWHPASFPVHNDFYILTGAHVSLSPECADCHSGDYVNNRNQCFECHQEDFNTTTNPNHQNLGLNNDCSSCHSTEPNWQPALFPVHDNFYMLTGAHVSLSPACSDCHEGNYNLTKNNCADCHQTDYESTINPSHQALNLSLECDECHSTQLDWKPALFTIHNQYYLLTGAHMSIADDCEGCHKGNYVNNNTMCYDCHLDDYNTAIYPNHQNLGIPTECRDCHISDVNWSPAYFTIHNQFYELLGAHELISNDCTQCHNTTYTDNKNTCYACHTDNFNSTTNPQHSQGFPTDCETCHTQNAWTPATFNHDQFYVLQGAHATITNNCSSCHNATFTDNKNTCYECHADEYNNTTSPTHNPTFATTCETCHSQNAWTPATFNHDQYYVLQGAHAAIANNCSACHNSTFTNNKSTCYECHSSDYNNATNPQHNPNFATTCNDCHSQTSWRPATFDHDNQYFPIYSGNHRNAWSSCSDCHTSSSYSSFSCIDCHEHSNQSSIDEEHNDVSNYVYSATSCYGCHPDGRESDKNIY